MLMTTQDDALAFYEKHYDALEAWLLRPGDKVMLGDQQNRVCRFCRKAKPDVTFWKVAHTIPEALGNKSIESAYECDACNESFGQGIENDLGNWSKPIRTLARIRGKSGVPTIKKGGSAPGWRIEYGSSGFQITAYEDDPFFEINEASKTITFKLRRDPHTPVAVLKAFMKIGLTLMPEEEVGNFRHLMAWVRARDHSITFADQCPVLYAFQPGPMPNDQIAAIILRRKPGVAGYPYAFLVLGFGNEVYQVPLPSQQDDQAMSGQSFQIPTFPVPGSPDPDMYGPTRYGLLDLTGRELVRDSVMTIVVGYERSSHNAPGDAPPPDGASVGSPKRLT